MNLPTSVVITGCDSMRILEQALRAARSFRPMKSAEIEALLAKTAPAAQHGKYEHYKTTHTFDGPIRILNGSDDDASFPSGKIQLHGSQLPRNLPAGLLRGNLTKIGDKGYALHPA